MKKIFTIIAAIAATAFLAGCSQPTSDSSSSSSSSDTTSSSSSSDTTSTVSSTQASVTYAMTAGTILKETETSSSDTYTMYLTFTSTTDGNCTQYKNGTVEKNAITFTYAPSTGLLTFSDGYYIYIFIVDGTYYWANFQFTRTSGSGLFGMWTAKSGSVTPGVSFASDGSCIIYTDGVQKATGTFTNKNGYITFTDSNGDVIPTTIIYSSDDYLYVECYTMTPVSAVGK